MELNDAGSQLKSMTEKFKPRELQNVCNGEDQSEADRCVVHTSLGVPLH